MATKSESKPLINLIEQAYKDKEDKIAKFNLDKSNKNDVINVITTVDQATITWLEENANLKFTAEHVLAAIDKKQEDKAIFMLKSKTLKFTNKQFFNLVEASAKAEFVNVTRTVLGLDIKFTPAIAADLLSAAVELYRHKDTANGELLRKIDSTKYKEYVNAFSKTVLAE